MLTTKSRTRSTRNANRQNVAVAPQATDGSTAKQDTNRNLSYRILLLSNTLGRAAARELAEIAGVTVPEWRIISVVGNEGPLSLNELSQTIAVDKAWVSRTLVQLEKRGFVKRSPQPKDGRLFSLALTEAGWSLHAMGSQWSSNRQADLKAAFGIEDYDKLEEFLTRLQTAAEQLLERPSHRPAALGLIGQSGP